MKFDLANTILTREIGVFLDFELHEIGPLLLGAAEEYNVLPLVTPFECAVVGKLSDGKLYDITAIGEAALERDRS